MKQRILLIALLLPTLLSAQDPKFRNGPKLGLTMSSQSSGGFLAWSGLPKFGPLIGWSFEMPVTSQLSLLLEPMYITKGYLYYTSTTKITNKGTFGYLELPMMVKISTNPDPQGLFITPGFMFGYWIYSHTYEAQDGTVRYDQTNDLYGATNRTQWSIGFGIGEEKGNWLWEVRGQNSFQLFTPIVYAHNVVFSGSVAYRFPLEKKKKKPADEDEDTP